MCSPAHLRSSYGRDEFVPDSGRAQRVKIFENNLLGQTFLLHWAEVTALRYEDFLQILGVLGLLNERGRSC
jgi:hypothetical protein